LKPYFSDKIAPIPSPEIFVMCTSLHMKESTGFGLTHCWDKIVFIPLFLLPTAAVTLTIVTQLFTQELPHAAS